MAISAVEKNNYKTKLYSLLNEYLTTFSLQKEENKILQEFITLHISQITDDFPEELVDISSEMLGDLASWKKKEDTQTTDIALAFLNFIRKKGGAYPYLVKDASKWKEMAGDTDLEKKINSYLTCRFIVSKDIPCNECLTEAKAIIKMVNNE